MTAASEGNLRVWWIPQVPGTPFHVSVKDTDQAIFLLRTLANYDLFQLKHRIKGDYCNQGGLEVFDDGEWVEWHHADSDQDIDEMMEDAP